MRVIQIDIRSLAFVRILLGALLATTFANFALFAPLLMSDSGVFPREMSLDATRSREFSLFLANGSALFQQILLVTATCSALLFACNVWPRVMLGACWVFFYSVTFRSTAYNFGICPAMLGVLFWALCAPWQRAPRWPFVSLSGRAESETRVQHWSLCGMFLICAAVSYGAGLAKFKNFDAWFVNFQALKLDLSYYTNVNPVTRALGQIPSFLEVASPLVVLVEMGTPLLLLVPFWRRVLVPLALVLATIVYGGIAISIHVGIFPLIPLTGFYLLIGPRFWEWCIRRQTVAILTRTAAAATSVLLRAGREFVRVMQVCLRYAGVVLVVLFGVKVVHEQTDRSFPAVVVDTFEPITAPIFDFFQVRAQWSWIYGGGIRNRFLLVRVQAAESTYWVNVTSVHYRGVIYNYFMNYSNSILRGKDDPQRLYHYARFLCAGGIGSTGLTSFSAAAQSIELFDVPDPANKLGKLASDEQDKLALVTAGIAPFFTYNCAQGRSSSTRGSDWQGEIGQVQQGSAVDLPLLGWSQDYGALRLNRAVDGAPISIRGKIFEQGFGTHANSRIRLSVRGLHRFQASVGIDDEKGFSQYSSAVVRIEGDGRELYRSPVLSTSTPAVRIDIDITGVSELVLISDDAGRGLGSNRNCDDHVSWGDPVVE